MLLGTRPAGLSWLMAGQQPASLLPYCPAAASCGSGEELTQEHRACRVLQRGAAAGGCGGSN